MKRKITLLCVLAITLSSWAIPIQYPTWCGNSYLNVNSGSGAVWYTGSNSYVQAGGLFQGANLGTFLPTASITLGGELQAYISGTYYTGLTTLYYRIDTGTFTAISLPNTGSVGNNSKHYGEGAIAFTGLSAGPHTLEVYFQAAPTVYDGNGGANFIASFTITSTTEISKSFESSLKISTQSGKIEANFAGFSLVELYSTTGQLINKVNVNGQYSKEVKSGAYLLRINGKTHKIVVQ